MSNNPVWKSRTSVRDSGFTFIHAEIIVASQNSSAQTKIEKFNETTKQKGKNLQQIIEDSIKISESH